MWPFTNALTRRFDRGRAESKARRQFRPEGCESVLESRELLSHFAVHKAAVHHASGVPHAQVGSEKFHSTFGALGPNSTVTVLRGTAGGSVGGHFSYTTGGSSSSGRGSLLGSGTTGTGTLTSNVNNTLGSGGVTTSGPFNGLGLYNNVNSTAGTYPGEVVGSLNLTGLIGTSSPSSNTTVNPITTITGLIGTTSPSTGTGVNTGTSTGVGSLTFL